MIEAIAWGVGITGTSFAVASVVKSLCGGGKTCDMHSGILDRLKLGDNSIENLNKGMGEVKEGVARIEGKLEILIKNSK
jgi:hypothetical protein